MEYFVADLAWGTKRTCTGCAARFYDLRKTPPVCPKCGTVVEIQAAIRGKRSKSSMKEVVLPVDDFDLGLGDNLDVVVDDDPSLLEDDENMDQGLGVTASLEDDVV